MTVSKVDKFQTFERELGARLQRPGALCRHESRTRPRKCKCGLPEDIALINKVNAVLVTGQQASERAVSDEALSVLCIMVCVFDSLRPSFLWVSKGMDSSGVLACVHSVYSLQ